VPLDSRDDFSGFEGREDVFHGLRDPFGMIRRELEQALREQRPDVEVVSIQMGGEPLVVRAGRKVDDESGVVTHFGFCLRALLALTYDAGQGHETLPAALSFLFAYVDQPPARRKLRTYFDLHGEAEDGFSEAKLKQRVLKLRKDFPADPSA
jgi:hypothetical protein